MLSKVTRDEYLEKYLHVPLGLPAAAGGTTLTNVATSDVVVAEIPVPRNMLLRKVGVAYTSETGTTPALTVKVKRSSTVLASAQATTAAEAVFSAAGTVFVKAGEVLSVAIAAAAADNDFVNPTAILVFCPVFSDE